ncbi:MAG: hypothetical protein ACLRQT_03380 [Alistipes sp.]
MYRRIIKPILFSLTIERAHHVALLLLRIIGLIPGGRWFLRKCYTVRHPALEREVFGVKFANPSAWPQVSTTTAKPTANWRHSALGSSK